MLCLFRNYLLLSIFYIFYLFFYFFLYCIFSLQESQTKEVLARVITEVHQEYGLDDKVVATTTDNGSNYRAAFHSFGSTSEPLERNVRFIEEDEEAAEDQRAREAELVSEDESRCVNLHDLMRDTSEEDSPDIRLPPHHRCRYCV